MGWTAQDVQGETKRERERERERLKETDEENHLGMDECDWQRWQLERKSLEI